MFASYPENNRHSSSVQQRSQQQHQPQPITIPQHSQYWSSTPNPLPIISTPQPQYNNHTNTIFSFGQDQPLFDYQTQEYQSSPSQSLMQSEHSNNSWLDNGQLTPLSTTRAHHRESSLSSLGSAGPSSPYTANTSNPHIVGELYHDFHDYGHTSAKPLTPAHTPSQEHFLTPHYPNYYQNSHLAYTMGASTPPKSDNSMPAPDFVVPLLRQSTTSLASGDSPATPPAYEEERNKHAYRSTVPKLDRTMTDVYADELYNPNFNMSAAPTSAAVTTQSPQNDVFSQRLQAANSQHLNASQAQAPSLTIPSRDRSPFRQGSPLAPSSNSFNTQSPNVRFGTATHMREQQKAENDAKALKSAYERVAPNQTSTNTISPKDVDLVYHETEEDRKMPLFSDSQPSSQQSPENYRQPETLEVEENTSQSGYDSMATSRRESSSVYSASSQATPQQNSYNFAAPAVPRQVPQQYPFVPANRRQPSNISNVTDEFPATLVSMESSSSEYNDPSEIKKPASTTADTGTYTCTYHGCTLRFDSPAKLQRHKREGHRSSAIVAGTTDEPGMTSTANRNSQAGPHKCERINPSTGKPCNTVFSRPYDLTRHEDTIHNARKQKVHCPYCTEEKTFSRNDALTRHLRVVHPDQIDITNKRRRGGHD